jgi:hypothetical protein
MLPDFPRAKEALQRYFISQIDRRSKSQLLDSIPNIRVHEGDGTAPFNRERADKDASIIQARLEVNDEDVIRDGYGAFQSKIDTVAKELETQKEKILISAMDRTARTTGNVTSAKGQPFSPRIILDALEKMEIEFDDKGKSKGLVLVVSPAIGEVISKNIADWEKNPEYAKAFDELMEKKRKEWRDREDSRKLVD